jgi:outer membrane receptor for ferrienterochelin and colicins
MSRRHCERALLLLAAGAVTSSAYADDTADLQSILSEHVITTASTTAQKDSAAPALSTTITSEDLKLYGIRTLAEAVNFLSMGVVTSDPLRTPDIGARGVLFENDNGKHFLLLVNGHAINDPLYGAARFDEGAGVPIDMVDHIEVVVGPGSVLYGSNAMMGVINVITKSGSAYKGGHVVGEYDFGRSEHAAAGVGTTFKLFGAPSELTLGVDYYRQSGPDVTFPQMTELSHFYTANFNVSFGPTEPASNVWGGTLKNGYFTEAPSAMLRFRSGDFELNLMASSYSRGIPYANSELPIMFDDAQNREVDRALRLDAKYEATLSSLVSLTSRVYADTTDHRRYLDVPGQLCLQPNPCRYYDAGLSRWAGIEEQFSFNWLHDQSLVTLVGIDVRERWASAKEDLSDATTGAYTAATSGHIDVNSLLVAPYVQQTYSPSKLFDFNAGARLDADIRFSAVLSPRGAAAVHPWDKGTFKAIYSQAFRAPTWSETTLANHLVAPSDSVQPETVRSIEGSFEQRLGAQRLIVSAFRTHWDHLIASSRLSDTSRTALQNQGRLPVYVGNIEQFTNTGGIDNYGFSLGFDGTLADGRLRYGATATEAFTTVASQVDGTLPVAPQTSANAHIAYAEGGYFPTPALAVSLFGPRPFDRLSANSTVLPPAPTMADLRLTFTGALPLKGLSYRASGEYITASRSPYGAGPDLSWLAIGGQSIPGLASPVPVPIDQVRAFVGLRYDFLTGEGEQP